MTENENIPPPVSTVMIRRGKKVAAGIPTKMLVPYIEGKRLLRSDEISVDGIRWLRLDQHHQLTRYFKDETSAQVLPDAPSPFPQEEDGELGVGPCYIEEENPASHPQPLRMEKELAKLADLLKDINS
ncbi:MAG: hypothetical protein ACE5E9_05625 [Nitrospinaceae bacterium]